MKTSAGPGLKPAMRGGKIHDKAAGLKPRLYHSTSRQDSRYIMIDPDGYRLNVGIILCNDEGRVFWARRIGMRSWQFPQGGIKRNEHPEAAMYRELYEEVGLRCRDVKIIGRTSDWLRYELPDRYIRKHSYPLCIGQKQLWFMLRLAANESRIRLDRTGKPEFDHWCWVDYWHPVNDVVYFKRQVYRQALTELIECAALPKPRLPVTGQIPAGQEG